MANFKSIVTELEGRVYVMATKKSGAEAPDVSTDQTFSDGAVWFVVEEDSTTTDSE